MPEDPHQDILDALGIKPLALDTTGASGGSEPGVTYSIGVNPSTHQTPTEGLGDALKKSKNLRDILQLDPVIHGRTSGLEAPAAGFFAKGAGELSGVSDLVRAVASGKPENMLYAGGMLAMAPLLPGAKLGKVTGTLMKDLTDSAYVLGHNMSNATPAEYFSKFHMDPKSFAKVYPSTYRMIEPHLPAEAQGAAKELHYDNALAAGTITPAEHAGFMKVLSDMKKGGSEELPGSPGLSSLDDALNAIHEALNIKDEGIPDKDISQSGIDKALAKNPAASIFDVAGLHSGGAYQNWEQKFKAGLDYSKQNKLREGDFPHEVPFDVPPKAQGLGFTTPVVHGTPDRYGWEGPLDQLKLPENQLGVHFGNPAQAAHFSIPGNPQDYLASKETYRAATPRTYPAVLQVQNPLETADMGSWGYDNMIEALHKINEGTLMSYAGGTRQVSPGLKGQFPLNELDKLKNIGDVRDYIASKGFDSIKYTNSVEDPGHTSYIMFQGSPTAPNYVTGVRSPFAQFDPSKLHLPSLTATGAGILAYPLTRQGDEEQ